MTLQHFGDNVQYRIEDDTEGNPHSGELRVAVSIAGAK